MNWTWLDIMVAVLSFIAGMMIVASWPRRTKRPLTERPLNMREADEIDIEDLEAAGEFYDRIMREQQD